MTFEQFLSLRLPDLVRFAVTLCGNRSTGDALADAAIRRVYQARAPIENADDAFAEVRAWVVRGYLSEGMELDRGPAADLDRPIVDAADTDPDWDDLTARFVTSSKLQRTVAALRYAEHLDLPDIAAAMGSTVDGITLYLQRVFVDLNIRGADGSGSSAPNPNTEDDVRSLLELYGDDVDPVVADQFDALVQSLPESPVVVAEREAAKRAEAERLEREQAEREAAERAEAERLEREAAERAEAERLEREQAEREAAERAEVEREAAERAEAERLEREQAERAEAERLEREQAEREVAERAEAERLEREAAERLEREQAEREQAEREAAEQAEREQAERAEAERLEREQAEREAAERAEAERLEREQAERAEAERLEREQAEREAAERAEAERLEREQAERAEAERLEREQAEREAAERAEAERLEREQAERAEAERLEREQAEREAAERAEAERLEREAAERAEAERLEREAAERAEAERLEREAAERAEAERLEREQAEREAAERAEAERLEREAAERAGAERLEREAAERAEAERLEREQAEREAAERAEAERLEREAAERAETERLEREQAERAEAERLEREQAEREAAERAEAERLEREAAERAEVERLEREQAERQAAERADAEAAEPAEPADAAALSPEATVRFEKARRDRETVKQTKADRAARSRAAQEESDRLAADHIARSPEEVDRALRDRETAERDTIPDAPDEVRESVDHDRAADVPPPDPSVGRAAARRLDRERKAAARAAKIAARQHERDLLRRERAERAEAQRLARDVQLANQAERARAAEPATEPATEPDVEPDVEPATEPEPEVLQAARDDAVDAPSLLDDLLTPDATASDVERDADDADVTAGAGERDVVFTDIVSGPEATAPTPDEDASAPPTSAQPAQRNDTEPAIVATGRAASTPPEASGRKQKKSKEPGTPGRKQKKVKGPAKPETPSAHDEGGRPGDVETLTLPTLSPAPSRAAATGSASGALFKPSDEHRTVTTTGADVASADASRAAEVDARRDRNRRLLTIGLIAALVILTVGIIAIAGRDSGSSAASKGSVDRLGLPSPVVRPLPGTKVIAQYAGTGSKTVDAGAPKVAAGRELALSVVCEGKGSLTVGPTSLDSCAVPRAFNAQGLSTSALRIVASPSMKWRIAFIDQPDSGTNGALANPPDPVLSNPGADGVLAAKTGSGDATIGVKRGHGKASGPIRIVLTCQGAGVTLASDDKAIDGRFARTCFSGWSYDFDINNVDLPTSFTVKAADDTTWDLVVIRL